MIELEENQRKLNSFREKISLISDSLKIEELQKEVEELNKKTLENDFWSNTEKANKTLSKIKEFEKKINKVNNLKQSLQNLIEMNSLVLLENDEDLAKEILDETIKLNNQIESLEIETLFSGKYDNSNAIITLHPGAGGTESQDWVEMLYRMYSKWSSSNGFALKELEYLPGDEAGIKSVTFLVSGENAYGYLKSEMGVHRLVRISPFDSGGRRHTSFASVEVLPEISEDVEVNINLDDLRIDTYRASGAGGQHINKTDSAVRITHIPTNIVVSCQSERSQTMNKETAMKMLKSKLLDLKEKENKETIDDLKGVQRDIAWGSQIRSYVFCPYTLVKDHRTNFETGNIESVMNGNITEFMQEYLKTNIKISNIKHS